MAQVSPFVTSSPLTSYRATSPLGLCPCLPLLTGEDKSAYVLQSLSTGGDVSSVISPGPVCLA